ncbi:MAG: STAS domain-containing protein [Candidatus Omnitrophica bacterium]|nr:STAS domain-containing protein [Candidatus Omnitrophota bacterium]
MEINIQKNNDVALCTITGEIDINNSPDLRKAFDQLISTNEKKVVVDFSAVPYIDSSGLATLIEMFQRLKRIDGHLKISQLDQKVKNIFEITKLNKLFEIYDSKEKAIGDFA